MCAVLASADVAPQTSIATKDMRTIKKRFILSPFSWIRYCKSLLAFVARISSFGECQAFVSNAKC